MGKRIHGMCKRGARHALHYLWCNMIRRCHSESSQDYRLYGARGIAVCEEWRKDFAAFVADMSPRPKGTSLDRIDNNGPYSKENCRWASPKTQSRNSRHNRVVEFGGKKQPLSAWAEEIGISYKTLMNRFYNGWSTERALSVRKNAYPFRYVEFNGETRTCAEWARHLGIPYKSFINRFYRGYSLQRIMQP